jgi:site-specific DNA recombinase
MTHTPPPNPPLPAVIYLRQSLDKTGERLAVSRQLEGCQQLCSGRGIPVLDVIEDNDVSATTGTRSGYERLMTMVTNGQVRVIVVYALDRLTRSMRDLERLIDLVESGGLSVVTVTAGALDLATPLGRMMARFFASIARQEVEVKAARQESRNRQAVQQGRPIVGALRTVGYADRHLSAVREDEAALIREGFNKFIAGATVRSIARFWNESRMVNSSGGTWDANNTRAALRNPRYAGLSVYRANNRRGKGRGTPELLGTGQWQPLVTMEVWEAAQAILADPTRKVTPGPARKHLMAGLARCGHCGLPLRSKSHTRGYIIYKCPTERMGRKAEEVNQYVREVVADYLRQPGGPTMGTSSADMAALSQDAAALRVKLDTLTTMFMGDRITQAQLDKGTADARARLEDIGNAQAANAGTGALAPLLAAVDPGQAFLDAPMEVQRAVISAVVTVTLHPLGKGSRGAFDPSTVTLDWMVSDATTQAA